MRRPRPPALIDFHVHTSYSYDCAMPPALVIEVARWRGLNGIAVTDHDTVEGALATVRANRHPDFLVIPGVEVKTDKGDVIGLYIRRQVVSRDFSDVIVEIHDQGGLVYIPHPIRTFGESGTIQLFRGFPKIDLWEIYNGRYNAREFAASQSIFGESEICNSLCGSDAHAPWEIGAFRTELRELPHTPEALVEASRTAVLDASPRSDFALRTGIALGALTKAYKRRQYTTVARTLATLPWKAARRLVRPGAG